jgi:hypothetical protein
MLATNNTTQLHLYQLTTTETMLELSAIIINIAIADTSS